MDQAVGSGSATRELERAGGPEGGDGPPLLVIAGLDKAFGTTRALEQIDFDVRAAEIVALMGGNGAGKSTLMRIVGGLLPPDSGRIHVLGHAAGPNYSPRTAISLGLRFVHQELSLCTNLAVYENFSLELPDVVRGLRWKRLAIDLAKASLEDVFPASGIDPRAKVGALSLSQQQMVEIARAVCHPAIKLVILDEPTSSLGPREAAQLRHYIKRRRNQGVSFIFISHRLKESLDLADRIVVMRNGRIAWNGDRHEISQSELLELLGGAEARAGSDNGAGRVRDETVVEISGSGEDPSRRVEFKAGRGEVIGLAGLEGGGQRHLLRSVFAAAHGSPAGIMVRGRVAFVSGDRASEGIFPLWSINDNIAASSFWRLTRAGLISDARLKSVATGWFDRLKIQATSGAVPIVSLSGGNQQKAIVARALAAEADLLLFDDPTRGVDLGTKADFYRLVRELASQGRTVLWYSSDDTEFAHCDRTLVMRDGAVVTELQRDELTEERLIEASFRSIDRGGAHDPRRSAGRARRREALASALIPLVTFVLVFALCAFLNPRIVSSFGLTLVFSAAFALSFAATSQLFIIAAGDIDLGLGTFIGLVNCVAATWLVDDPWLAWLCFAGLLAAYPIMGLFVEMRRVPAIIVTLGLSFVWLGLAATRLPRAGGGAPDWLVEAMRIKIPLIPLPVLLCVAPAIVAYLVLMVWRYGVVLRGYGANPRAIEAAGWSARLAKAALYGMAGVFAILTGILVTASTRGGDPTGSTSMTLLSVAAVILGGAAFSGGLVAPVGALFGSLTLVLVGTLLSLLGANAVFLPMVQGLLLLGVIGVRTIVVGRQTA